MIRSTWVGRPTDGRGVGGSKGGWWGVFFGEGFVATRGRLAVHYDEGGGGGKVVPNMKIRTFFGGGAEGPNF